MRWDTAPDPRVESAVRALVSVVLGGIVLLAGCPEPVDYEPVRFAALGDTGEANDAQYEVGAVLADVCASDGCDFVLLLGDNFYDTGVESVDDEQWQTKFELPYAGIDLPFYAVLGNHDYGGTNHLDKAVHQIAYTDLSDRWTMPDHYFAHTASNVDFFALDTNLPQWPVSLGEIGARQESWLAGQFADFEPDDRWRIVWAHHPYLSNGKHGNAGNYDGFPDTFTLSGQPNKELLEAHVCGKADLYLCGHDHDREWLEPTCEGTELIVSGAGSKLRDFYDTQPVHWQDSTTEGLAWFEIDDETITIRFWDRDGTMAFEGGWTRE